MVANQNAVFSHNTPSTFRMTTHARDPDVVVLAGTPSHAETQDWGTSVAALLSAKECLYLAYGEFNVPEVNLERGPTGEASVKQEFKRDDQEDVDQGKVAKAKAVPVSFSPSALDKLLGPASSPVFLDPTRKDGRAAESPVTATLRRVIWGSLVKSLVHHRALVQAGPALNIAALIDRVSSLHAVSMPATVVTTLEGLINPTTGDFAATAMTFTTAMGLFATASAQDPRLTVGEGVVLQLLLRAASAQPHLASCCNRLLGMPAVAFADAVGELTKADALRPPSSTVTISAQLAQRPDGCPPGACYTFFNQGSCQYGRDCRFAHEASSEVVCPQCGGHHAFDRCRDRIHKRNFQKQRTKEMKSRCKDLEGQVVELRGKAGSPSDSVAEVTAGDLAAAFGSFSPGGGETR